MTRTLFFDLETQRSFQEVGGRDNLGQLGLSVAVTYCAETGEYRDYLEPDAQALARDLMEADLVVGFNVLAFDYPVLRPYTTEPLERIRTVDMLAQLYNSLGFRVALDNIATTTLGASKLADGLQAIRWYREGKIAELLAYCRQDVNVTRLVYEFGREHRHVAFADRMGRIRRVRVNW